MRDRLFVRPVFLLAAAAGMAAPVPSRVAGLHLSRAKVVEVRPGTGAVEEAVVGGGLDGVGVEVEVVAGVRGVERVEGRMHGGCTG